MTRSAIVLPDCNTLTKQLPLSLLQFRKSRQIAELQTKIGERLSQNGFEIHAGSLTVTSVDRFGNQIRKQVANFVFWPAKEFHVQENGQPSYEYEIEGLMLTTRKKLPPIRLTAKKLDSGSWISQKWGIEPIVEAGMYRHARKAFQFLHSLGKQTRLFKQTGWRRIDQEWLYVHATGAIGNGTTNVEVCGDFSAPKIARYALPDNCSDSGKAAAVMQNILDIGSPHVAYPLAAMIWLPPLAEHFRQQNNPISFITFLKGSTACGKSSLAALALSAFGEMDKYSFPASFRDTLASMETTFATLKDSLCVVDDYHPRTSSEQTAMNSTADSIGRMVADGNVRNRYHKDSICPQAVVLATGEAIPTIAPSGLSRYLFVECKAENLDYNGRFKYAQQNCAMLREAMRDYLGWIAANWDRIHDLIKIAFHHHFTIFRELGNGRSVTAAAQMACAVSLGLTYLQDRNLLDQSVYEDHMSSMQRVLTDILQYNLSLQAEISPSQTFLSHLQKFINSTNNALVALHSCTFPAKAIGCYDETTVYLIPEKAYNQLERFMNRHDIISLSPERELWQSLANNNVISWDPVRKRHTRQKRLPCMDNKNIDVLMIDRQFLPDLSF